MSTTTVFSALVAQMPDGDNRAYRALLRGLRRWGKCGFALLTDHRRALRHLDAGPSMMGDVAQAATSLIASNQ